MSENIILAKREFARRIALIANDLNFIMREENPEEVIDGICRAISAKYKVLKSDFSVEAASPEQIKKELSQITKQVEEYLNVEMIIQSQVQEFQDKLEKRLGLEKLRGKYEQAVPKAKELVKGIEEHKAIVSSVFYKLKDAFSRRDVADSETVNRVLELIKKLVKEDKLKRFRQLSRKLFEEHEVKEKFDVQLLEPEEVEHQKTKLEKEKARASLQVNSSFWEGIKQFFSEFLNFLIGDKEQWEQALQGLQQAIPESSAEAI